MRFNIMLLAVGALALAGCPTETPKTPPVVDTDDTDDTNPPTPDTSSDDTAGGGTEAAANLVGAATYDSVGGTYLGTEGLQIIGPTAGLLCELTWTAIDLANDPNPSGADPTSVDLCDDPDGNPCDFGLAVTFHDGIETGPAAGCAAFGLDATWAEGAISGYGYMADYSYGGTALGEAFMYFYDTSWIGLVPNDLSYNAATGDFTYDLPFGTASY